MYVQKQEKGKRGIGKQKIIMTRTKTIFWIEQAL